MFLRGRYFIAGSPIDMNVDVFWETSVGFLKYVVLQLFLKYSQSYVNLIVKKYSKIELPLKSRRVVLVFSIWIYSPGHNISRHFGVWQNFRVTTSETNRDY